MVRCCSKTTGSSSTRARTPAPSPRGAIMAKEIPWRKTISTRLGAITLVLLAMALVLIIGNLAMITYVRRDTLWLNLIAGDRMRYYQILFLANLLVDEKTDEGRRRYRAQLDQV